MNKNNKIKKFSDFSKIIFHILFIEYDRTWIFKSKNIFLS